MATWTGKGRIKPIRQSAYHVVGLNEALRVFKRLPAEADKEVRAASGRIAAKTVAGAKSKANMTGYRVTRLAARSLSVKQTRAGKADRIPTVVLGNQTLLPGRAGRPNARRQTYNAIAAGAEFGGSRGSYAARAGAGINMSIRTPGGRYSTFKGSTKQFPPYRVSPSGKGGAGYFLYPTVRAALPWAMTEWSRAMKTAIVRA
jgi:hypothetical protein